MTDLPQLQEDNGEAVQPPLAGSLIVCTRNRAQKLLQCLSSIRTLDALDRWELVVVDNGSTDSTSAVLDSFRTGYPWRMISVNEARPGLGRARNAGVAAAAGPLLAFTDDDCYPKPDFLVQVERAFEDPDLGYMGGRIELFNHEDAPITIRVTDERIPIAAGQLVRTGIIQGANMACRRAVVDEVGAFDPEFGAGTPFPAEDVDFAARASVAGWKGGYFPEPVVYHDHGRRGDNVVRQLRKQYDLGRGAYYAKHVLRSDTRRRALQRWVWSTNLGDRKLRLYYEILGACHYVLHRIATRLGCKLKEPPSKS